MIGSYLHVYAAAAGAEDGQANPGVKRMLDGTAAGMITGRELMVEMEKKRKARPWLHLQS